MKKVIFMLAFILTSTFSFANELTSNETIKEPNKIEVKVNTVLNEDFSCSETHYVYYDGVLVAEFEIEKEDDCETTLHLIRSKKK